MLFSISLVFLCAIVLSEIAHKLKLPGLVGMLLTGIILGPYALKLITPEILDISTELREIALIVILIRAGLALNIDDLKKVGKPAVLLSFIPATFEIITVAVLAPLFFTITQLDAVIMGTVLAAVSPSVIVPKMLNLMARGYGKKQRIPQLIMASVSVNGIYVIVLFTSFMNMADSGSFEAASLINIPIAIIAGLLLGILTGLLLDTLFKKISLPDIIKVLIILSTAFLFVTLESSIKMHFSVSGLLASVALGGTILKRDDILAKRLSETFSKIWVGAEIILFVLLGATVDISHVLNAGVVAVLLIIIALVIRLGSIFACLIKTNLKINERFFCAISYFPKATVQAAIGGLPLAAGMAAGNTILTISVLAILITAPLGAIGVDATYKKLLTTEESILDADSIKKVVRKAERRRR